VAVMDGGSSGVLPPTLARPTRWTLSPDSLAVVSFDRLAHSYAYFLALNFNRKITTRPTVCGDYTQTLESASRRFRCWLWNVLA